MIILDDTHLMMIEPKRGSKSMPISDPYTIMAEELLKTATTECPTRGWHRCKCGANSDNVSHVLPCGTITNSLLVHYVSEHRDEVPESEMNKLSKLWMQHVGNKRK